MAGIELIAIRRKRRVAEGRENIDDELALAAICYAAPVRLYVKDEHATALSFDDRWPQTWDASWDNRFYAADRGDAPKSRAPNPATYSHKERLDLLIEAGALIAAEVDRLQKLSKPESKAFAQRFFFLCDLSSPKDR